ncbi:MAG: hypothetical protein H6698_01550 [Myxococcales bacterium]|nr:hypothetical protein [Myxococcales bacterium]MCB9532995.1 hypothetical protein [Myxococcales bacterium]
MRCSKSPVRRTRRLFALGLVGLGVGTACHPVYRLPDPPPREAWAHVEIDPSAARVQSDEAFTAARRVLVSLYEAAGAGEWATFAEGLSAETRVTLGGGNAANAESALAAGRVTVGGREWAFEPIGLLLPPNPTGFSDTRAGEHEEESARRKEVFVESGDEARRVVMIWEGDAWRVHVPRLRTSDLAPVAAR